MFTGVEKLPHSPPDLLYFDDENWQTEQGRFKCPVKVGSLCSRLRVAPAAAAALHATGSGRCGAFPLAQGCTPHCNFPVIWALMGNPSPCFREGLQEVMSASAERTMDVGPALRVHATPTAPPAALHFVPT